MVKGSVNPDDRWLSYVKQQLAKRSAGQAATSVSLEPVRDYQQIGQFIYRFHRVVARDDLDGKTLAGKQVPGELLLRAGRLADEFDHIVGSRTVADAELKQRSRGGHRSKNVGGVVGE